MVLHGKVIKKQSSLTDSIMTFNYGGRPIYAIHNIITNADIRPVVTILYFACTGIGLFASATNNKTVQNHTQTRRTSTLLITYRGIPIAGNDKY